MLCRPGEGLALLSPGGRLGEGALPIAQPVQQPSPQAVPALGGHRLKQGCITVYGALPVPMRNGREEPGKPLASGLLKQGAVGGDTSELGVKCSIWTASFLLTQIIKFCQRKIECVRIVVVLPKNVKKAAHRNPPSDANWRKKEVFPHE